jgi:hypothetical protein
VILKLGGGAGAFCLWKRLSRPRLPLAGAVPFDGEAAGGAGWAGGAETKTKPELIRPSGWQPSKGVPEVTVWFCDRN